VSSILEFLSSFADKEAQEEAAKPGIARKWAESIVGLPRDVYQSGSPDVGAGEGLGYALNALSPGMAAAPKNALGIFGGRASKTANKNMLNMAEAMEKAGSNPDDIWNATGWGRTKDKSWVYEISDSNMKLKEQPNAGDEARIGSFVEHPELKEAYPDVWDNLNMFGTEPSVPYHGIWQSDNYSVGLNPTLKPKDARSVALHELEHVISKHEGRSDGANPEQFGNEVAQADAKLRRIVEAREKIYQRRQGAIGVPSRAAELEALNQADRKLSELQNRAVRETVPYSHYKRNAGEVGARNVQARDRLRQEDPNLSLAPWYTEDIPRSRQRF
jgi:hypothetical protein